MLTIGLQLHYHDNAIIHWIECAWATGEQYCHIFQPCSFTNHPPNSLPPASAVLSVVSGVNHTLVVLLESVDQLGLKKVCFFSYQ